MTSPTVHPPQQGWSRCGTFRRPEKGGVSPMGHSLKTPGWMITKTSHQTYTKPNRFGPKMKMCLPLFMADIHKNACPTFMFDASIKKHHGHPGILFRIIDVEFVGVFLEGCFFFFVRFVLSKQGDSYNHLVNWLADARCRVFFVGVTRWVVGPDIKYI